MANVHDYLRWRGDISLSERLFNDADNIVLSLFAYLDFTGIVPSERRGGSVRLSSACNSLLKRCGGDIAPAVRSLIRIDTDFAKLVAGSARFGDARLSSYVDIVDEARSLQFSALQIDLPDASTYIAFRGTDATLVGWREDFMQSFCVTEAHREAQAYLERALGRCAESSKTIFVGGHSKGGGLAEYAVSCCSEEQRDRISCVYSNDGPGLAPEVSKIDGRGILGTRFRHIVPAYSIVGMLYARAGEPLIVVQSTGAGIGQHDLSSWKLTRDGVLEAEGLQQDCLVLNEAIARWAESIPLDERERVVDEVFDALGAGGATRLDEIAATTEGLQQVLRALGSTDERTREVAIALAEGTVSSSVEAVRRSTQDVIDTWRRSRRSHGTDVSWLLRGGGGEVRMSSQLLREVRRRGRRT